MKTGTILAGVDILDVISFAARKNKKFQAVMLNQLEEVLGKDSVEYSKARKIVLDGMNNYTRSILRTFFGGVEDMVK